MEAQTAGDNSTGLTNQDVATWPVGGSSTVKRAYRGCMSNTLRVVVEHGTYRPPEGWQIDSVRQNHGKARIRISRTDD